VRSGQGRRETTAIVTTRGSPSAHEFNGYECWTNGWWSANTARQCLDRKDAAASAEDSTLVTRPAEASEVCARRRICKSFQAESAFHGEKTWNRLCPIPFGARSAARSNASDFHSTGHLRCSTPRERERHTSRRQPGGRPLPEPSAGRRCAPHWPRRDMRDCKAPSVGASFPIAALNAASRHGACGSTPRYHRRV
jgi:hypothetical protein